MKDYGALVKQRREAAGMTIEELSRALGRPNSFVWRIEQGKNANPPDPETTRQIWRVLSIPLRTQLIQLGYLDPDAPEPGVAYAVPDGSVRADLLRMLEGVTDADLENIKMVLGASLLLLGPKSYGPASDTERDSTGSGTQTNRSA